MTISVIKGNIAECQWFDEKSNFHSHEFESELLEKVSDKSFVAVDIDRQD